MVAQVTSVIAKHDIGLSSLVQPKVEGGAHADLMLMMHAAPFGRRAGRWYRRRPGP